MSISQISELEHLEQEINDRQQDLDYTLKILENSAARESRRAIKIRILIIFLGAFSATKAVADRIAGSDTTIGTVNTIIYALAGLLIATLGSVEAAFDLQKRGSSLRRIAVDCKAHILDINYQMSQNPNASPENRIQAARNLLALQNNALKDIQGRASEFGVNISRTVRILRGRTAKSGDAV